MDLEEILNSTYHRVVQGDEWVQHLSDNLNTYRSKVSESDWRTIIKKIIYKHAIYDYLAQDPLTARARSKPRGYAGDAVMMDFMYDRQPPHDTSIIGKQLFNETTKSPCAESARWRRDHITKIVDEIALRIDTPSIMSVACGHCREAQISKAVKEKKVKFTALDNDAQSLEEIKLHTPQIRTVQMNVTSLSKDQTLGKFNLIYSAGLYDYLKQDFAERLTHHLFERLLPGGELLIANFTPSNKSRSYMEAFMDWHLILRDEHDMQQLRPNKSILNHQIYRDTNQNVVYLRVTKGSD